MNRVSIVTTSSALLMVFLLFGFHGLATEDHRDEAQQHEHADEHDDHHDHGGGKAIGPGKAIEEIDEDKGFKLSAEARTTIGVKTQVLNERPFEVPKTSLVYNTNQVGVYRLRQGFFKWVILENGANINTTVKLPSSLFQTGDEVATQGLNLLRVADIYSTDKSEYGHGH